MRKSFVTTGEAEKDYSIAEKRIEEANDIIYRVAMIWAMEEERENESLV